MAEPMQLDERNLWESDDVAFWRSAFNMTEKSTTLVTTPRKPHLQEDDVWIREELPQLLAQRSPPHMTKSELSRVMRWKLARGKFRARLQSFVESNPADSVKSVSEEAFQLCQEDDIKSAISRLSKLKGVGPATASAILGAFDKRAPFMADEALESVRCLKPIKYTLSHYMKFVECMSAKAEDLNSLGEEKGDDAHEDGVMEFDAWTVSQCLWAFSVAQKAALKEAKRLTGRKRPRKRSVSRTPSSSPKKKKRRLRK